MNDLIRGCTLQHGKYTIVKTLGRGSFCITYLATTKVALSGGLGKMDVMVNVAIKEFFMEDLNSRSLDGSSVENTSNSLVKNYRKKFHREAENLGKLNHPNIVKVLEVFDENNTTYYAMEYVDGQSLDDYIKNNGRISEKEVVSLLQEIGAALEYMHHHNMLHLDLKPNNVMRNKDGHLLLIDFGLSKQYDQNGEPESSTTLGLGTPGYAPIEQANYKQDGSFPATLDVYALGATLYKMLTGSTPPHASDIISDGFPNDLFVKLGISAGTTAMIRKAMNPKKKQRFQTVSELLKDVKSANHDGTGNNYFNYYEKVWGEAEYEIEEITNVEIDAPLPVPDCGISIELINPAPGSLSYKFYLNEGICNTAEVYRNGRKILDEDYYGGIRPEVIEALKQNGFFSKVHWELESSTTILDGITVSCSFYYKNGDLFVREVKHAHPAFNHLLLDAVNNVVKVHELYEWINEALNREHKYSLDDIKQYGISVFSFSPDYKLIYYRGLEYSGENIGRVTNQSEVEATFDNIMYHLQKNNTTLIDLDSYLRNHKEEICRSSLNIITYCSESDLLKVLYKLRQNPSAFGRYRIVQEMQLLPLCLDASEDAKYAYEYQHLYCETWTGGGVAEIIQAGFTIEKDDYEPETQVKHLSNFEGFAYLLSGAMIQYHIINKVWEDDRVLLSVIPFAIKAELWIKKRYRDGIKLIERNTCIPCKKTEMIIDENCTIIILFLGKRYSIKLNELFQYNPKSIEVTVEIDASTIIKYNFRDKEMNKKISISQTELFNYEVKNINEDTIW